MENTEKGLVINYADPKTINLLKNTVAVGATDAEFAMFCEFAKSTGLNPFKKEVWFIKANGKVQMMTGVNGFYTIANSHPQYDGIEVELVFDAQKKLEKAIARAYRKDRRIPSTAEAYWCEYGKDYGNWKIMPRVMLSKCAESMALRKAFPQELNGLYTAEEMPAEYNLTTQNVQHVTTYKQAPVAESVSVAVAQDMAAEAPQEMPVEAPENNSNNYPDNSAVVGVWKYQPPFKLKDSIKKMGARWNPETKSWDSKHEIPSFRDFLLSSPEVEKAVAEQAMDNNVVTPEIVDDIPF